MIDRKISLEIEENLKHFPAVAILGPRQSGKSTLAIHIMSKFPNAVYLDLENPLDMEKISDPLMFLTTNSGSLVCLDEIQRLPEIFPVLRSVIDTNSGNGQFLLLGSASPDLLKQSSESLAGRISYKALTPFLYEEINGYCKLQQYWLRGGFPRSVLAESDRIGFEWLNSFILTFLERDIPQLGFRIPAGTIRRLWTMCAHLNGEVLNASKLGESLGVSSVTVRKYIDLLVNTYMVRLLKPYAVNVKKRMIKSPKIYIRDTGIVNALLQVTSFNQLMSHPKFGSSWEGLVIENIANAFPEFDVSFYRTQDGAEIDLILHNQNMLFAIECKCSMAPKVTRGFWTSLDVIKPNRSYVAAPIKDCYKIGEETYVCNFDFIINDIASYILSNKASLSKQQELFIKKLETL